jgi:hypothetical protein
VAVGFFGGATGLLVTSGVDLGTAHVGGVLPGMLLLGLCMGLTFPTTTNAALHEVTARTPAWRLGCRRLCSRSAGRSVWLVW